MCVTFTAGVVCKSTFRDQTSERLNLRVEVVNKVKMKQIMNDNFPPSTTVLKLQDLKM